jgi:RNA polymerase sigma factor (sigma-70 family)
MKSFSSVEATDAQLLARVQEIRDPSAFAELVRRHGPMVIATARRTLNNREDVDDAFQATMLALAKAAGTLHKGAAVAGWLHKTAHTCAVTIQRANYRWERKADRLRSAWGEPDDVVDEEDPLKRVTHDEIERILDEEIGRLSVSLREVIVRCELEGTSQKDVATQLGISASAVHDRITKGRKLLRDRLVRRGVSFSLAGLATQYGATSQAAASVSDALVASVSHQAAMFAAGRSAAEVGVAPTVFQLANKVVLRMMKTRLTTRLLSALAIVLFGGWLLEFPGGYQSAAGATMLVVPNGLDDVEGNFDWTNPDMAWPFPLGTRNQFFVPARHFESLSDSQRLITGYRHRPDRNLRSPRTVQYERVRVTLSTTDRTADNLSRTFQDNVGPDATVVYDGPLTFATSNLGSPDGPKEFDYVTDFDTPFRYDPDQGNLLISVQWFGRADFDAVDSHEEEGVMTLFAPSPTANVASQTAMAIPVFQFVMVPEPSTASLRLSTIGMLLLFSGWRLRTPITHRV